MKKILAVAVLALGLFAASCDTPVQMPPDQSSACETHAFGAWQTVQTPSCTEDGSEERSCETCGEKQTRAVSAKGHTPGFWTSSVSPTCLAVGEEQRSCTECGFRETREVAARGHYFTEWSVNVASCTQGTEKSRFCIYCGEKQTEYFSAVGHIFGEWILETYPGCDENGKNVRTCAKCGEQEYQILAPTGHELSGIRCDKCAEYILPSSGHDLYMLDYEFGIQLDYCYVVRENDEDIYRITYTVSGSSLDPKTHASAPQGCFVLYAEGGTEYWYANRIFLSRTGKALTETIDIHVPHGVKIVSLEFKKGVYVDTAVGPMEGDLYWKLDL